MNRKVLIAAAVLAAIATALLLIPTSGGKHKKAKKAETTQVEKADKADRANDVVADKTAQKAAAEARKGTPYFKHSSTTTIYWQLLAKEMVAAGDEERATKAKELVRNLRAGSRPDGTDEIRNEALKSEEELLKDVASVYTDGQAAKIVAYLQACLQAVREGAEPPPRPTDIQAGRPNTPPT